MIKRSKLLAPSQDGSIARPHLLRAMHNSRRVTLISAPAGFGKSALASAWLAEQPGWRGWLSLDAGDRTGSALWLHLIACLQQAWPRFGGSAQKLLQIDPDAMASVVDLLAEDLIEWRTSGPAGAALVLDDLHVIDGAPNLPLLLDLVVLAADVMRLVITTRTVAFLATARALKPGMIDLLDQHSLMFSEDEVETLARSHGLQLSEKLRRDLLARTGGWVTPIHMILSQMRVDACTQAWNNAWLEGQSFALTALIRDHFESQPPAARDALCALALADQFDRTLMTALSVPDLAGPAVADLICADTFMIRLAQPGWWKIHDLYRAHLLEELKRLAPDLREQRVAIVADWCSQNGSPQQALQMLQEHTGFPLLRAHLLRHYRSWLRQGKFDVLACAARQLTPAQIEQDPELCLLYLWANIDQLGLEQCHAHVQRMIVQVEQHPDLLDLLSEIHTVSSYCALVKGRAAQAMQEARLAVQLSQQARQPFRSRALTTIGLLTYMSGHMGEASAALSEALVCAQDEGHFFNIIIALGYWAAALHQAGQFSEALAICERTGHWLEERGAVELAHNAWLSQAPLDIIIARGEMQEAQRRLTPLLQFADRATPSLRTALIYFRAVRFHYYNGDSHTALEYLNRVELALGKLTLDWTWGWAPASAWRRKIALRQNRRQELENWYREHPLSGDDDIAFRDEEERLLDADILSQIGQPLLAEKLAQTIVRNAGTHERVFNRLLGLIVLGNIADQRDRLAPNPAAAEAEALAQQMGATCTLRVEARWTAGAQAGARPDTVAVNVTLAHSDFISKREHDVLVLLAQGKSDREIAEALHISFNTAKTHMKNILRKLDVKNRTEALVSAKARGIL